VEPMNLRQRVPNEDRPVSRCLWVDAGRNPPTGQSVHRPHMIETAATLGITRPTAKTHLEHIFLKTGVTRQAVSKWLSFSGRSKSARAKDRDGSEPGR
jgi:hypothetical protein